MSSFGTIYAQIIAREKEQARLRQVRQQFNNLISEAERKFEDIVENPIYSGLTGDVAGVRKEIQEAKSTINPDQALLIGQKVSEKINSIMSIVISKERQWSEDRRIAYNEMSNALQEIKTIPIETKGIKSEMDDLVKKLEERLEIASTAQQQLSFVKSIKEKASLLREKDEGEIARREVVKKVITALKSQGFTVDSPKIKDNIVHLSGQLPSGKIVLFQVMGDNLIKFDFDGYEGTSCKNELDAVLEKINGEEGIQAEIEQFVWKNPDRIKSGSINAPHGSHAKKAGGNNR